MLHGLLTFLPIFNLLLFLLLPVFSFLVVLLLLLHYKGADYLLREHVTQAKSRISK